MFDGQSIDGRRIARTEDHTGKGLNHVHFAVEELKQTAALVFHLQMRVDEHLLAALARDGLLADLLVAPIGKLQLGEEERAELLDVELEIFDRLRPGDVLRRAVLRELQHAQRVTACPPTTVRVFPVVDHLVGEHPEERF